MKKILLFSLPLALMISAPLSAKPTKEEILAKYDTNGDGKLDPSEREAMKSDKKANMKNKLDTDGDGVVSEEEKEAGREAMKERRFEEMDTNGDGTISKAEWMAYTPAKGPKK